MTIGAYGEQLARQYLQKRSYTILTSNFRIRGGEIDIICKKDNTTVFVEVKARLTSVHGKPYEAVRYQKFMRLKRAAYYYIVQNHLSSSPLRIDVVSIELNSDKSVHSLEHFKNVEVT